MKQRLEQFLAAENLTKSQFADSINMARAGISHILAGRNNPSYEFIVNTMAAYPSLNIEWLLCGNGKMYKNTSDNVESGRPHYDSYLFAEDGTPGYSEQPTLTTTKDNNIQNVVEQLNNQAKRPLSPTIGKASRKTPVKIVFLYNDYSFEVFG